MNNPPAFPVQSIYIEDQETNSRGMTLRDYFAAKAMQAMLAHPDSKETAPPQTYANASYIMADAMLRARDEK